MTMLARTIYDFRSDTVTLPTAEMMAAVMQARLGDSGRGDDPTVNELERLAAGLTGKNDALFLPSGTMANLSAVIAHGCRGGEVIVEEAAHIYNRRSLGRRRRHPTSAQRQPRRPPPPRRRSGHQRLRRSRARADEADLHREHA